MSLKKINRILKTQSLTLKIGTVENLAKNFTKKVINPNFRNSNKVRKKSFSLPLLKNLCEVTTYYGSITFITLFLQGIVNQQKNSILYLLQINGQALWKLSGNFEAKWAQNGSKKQNASDNMS
jgi:hypothetical protein